MVEISDIVVTKSKTYVISDTKVKMLQMAANDVSRVDIAKKMKLSLRTVESHFDNVRKAFKCKSTVALVAILIRRGILK